MQVNAALAMIPKARGMYAKRLSLAEYEGLMRLRTVPEVASQLKRHPYFKDSLATLSTAGPHRGQVEELLEMDIFHKYEALIKYEFDNYEFSNYFLRDCEVKEILKAFHFISVGLPDKYVNLIPTYLVGKTQFDLFALSEAASFAEVLEVLRFTPYYKVLQERYKADPKIQDFPLLEARLLQERYRITYSLIEETFEEREAVAVKSLFALDAEIYNLSLLYRIKSYFPDLYTTDQIRQLLLPYRYRLSRSRLENMIQAPTAEALLVLYGQFPVMKGNVDAELFATLAGRYLYASAQHLLRLTPSPAAAMAAFLLLARLEKENIINVIEGVRYGLPPEKIKPLLHI